MNPDAPLYGTYLGTVVSVDDPLEANRVRVKIPGICEPFSNWARQEGRGFGVGHGFGFFGVPPEGSEVLVTFEAGDIDSPWYRPADIGAADIPSEVRGTPTKWMMSFLDIRMLFEVQDVGGQLLGKVKIYSNKLGEYNYIEIDGANNKVSVEALTDLAIKAVGRVNIQGVFVTIQGRPVTPGGKPI